MSTEEILDLLPDMIVVKDENPNHVDRYDKYGNYMLVDDDWYHFLLEKDGSNYTLSYYNYDFEKYLAEFSGSLHEIAIRMYEWYTKEWQLKNNKNE